MRLRTSETLKRMVRPREAPPCSSCCGRACDAGFVVGVAVAAGSAAGSAEEVPGPPCLSAGAVVMAAARDLGWPGRSAWEECVVSA